jgi:hypothetical protein
MDGNAMFGWSGPYPQDVSVDFRVLRDSARYEAGARPLRSAAIAGVEPGSSCSVKQQPVCTGDVCRAVLTVAGPGPCVARVSAPVDGGEALRDCFSIAHYPQVPHEESLRLRRAYQAVQDRCAAQWGDAQSLPFKTRFD